MSELMLFIAREVTTKLLLEESTSQGWTKSLMHPAHSCRLIVRSSVLTKPGLSLSHQGIKGPFRRALPAAKGN